MDWSVCRGGRVGSCTCDKYRREWTGLSGGEEGRGWELHVIKMEEIGLVCLEGRKEGGCTCDKDGKYWTGLSGGEDGGRGVGVARDKDGREWTGGGGGGGG